MRCVMSNNLILAITKIGDLLLNNKITNTEDGNSINNIKLMLPEYQRPYKWTAKNVNQLMNDIEEAIKSNKEVYRVGTLILHYEEKDKSYNIVDGQQRIITFVLLLKCICDGEQIDFLKRDLANNSYNIHNVINNYRTIERHIDNFSEKDKKDEKEALGEYIKNHCELIVVITYDLSEAFQFFDSQNARGKELYPHDLLKAYHLREMQDVGVYETEKIVKTWEDINQEKLSILFKEYLYRLKEWIKGNKAWELNESNIDLFKGISTRDNYPYAQYYKSAFAYADNVNHSLLPFVTGIQRLNSFQLNTPIIAGKPFFEYAKHYFDILADIQNNDKYEGYFIKDNDIVKTLDLRKYRNGVGNRITRLMFDTAILLYVDRFCPEIPSKLDSRLLEQFIIFAFIWAYSMRAQYVNIGWQVAQNYIMGTPKRDIENAFNIYKVIADADSPNSLLNVMSDLLMPLNDTKIIAKKDDFELVESEVYQNYLYYFDKYDFWEGK